MIRNTFLKLSVQLIVEIANFTSIYISNGTHKCIRHIIK